MTRELFDTEAFELWVLEAEPTYYFPSFGRWEKSPKSNSMYCQVTALIEDENYGIQEYEFTLHISDHFSPSRKAHACEVEYTDMPDSQTLAEDGFTWKTKPRASWNNKRYWKGIIAKIDAHVEKICPGCFSFKDTCACEDIAAQEN
jgi:hypothetical protein